METVYSVPGVRLCRLAVAVPFDGLLGLAVAPPPEGVSVMTYDLKSPAGSVQSIDADVAVINENLIEARVTGFGSEKRFLIQVNIDSNATIASPWVTMGSRKVRDHETFVRLRVRDLIVMRCKRSLNATKR